MKHHLIYRLRNRGFRIDTRRRVIYITEGYNNTDTALLRLQHEHHFVVQKECTPTAHARVYISGPISHYDIDERRKTFRKAERFIRSQGYLPVNPFNNGVQCMPDDANWRDHMRADIRMLLSCQYIYFLPEWELSKGCRLELDIAASIGVKVLRL